jgi:hypothetical protein
VIDENTAPIVRKMFKMRASGMSFKAITESLNKDGVLCPREYYYQGKGSKNPRKTRQAWGETTVKDILKNEVYIGHLISGKTGTVSYKNQKQIKKDEDNWIRIENSHEPIIDIELWNRVQSYIHRQYKPRQQKDSGKKNLFVGMLFCADCGFRLRGQVDKYIRKDGSEHRRVSYMCSTYANNGKDICTVHGIGENPLAELVIAHIRKFARLVQHDEKRMTQAVLVAKKVDTTSYQGSYVSELEAHHAQIRKLDVLIENLYTDKISGLIPDSLFKRQIQKYEKERIERVQATKTLEKRIDTIKPVADNTAEWIHLMKQYAEIDTLDTETLLLLIDKIIVSEAQYISGQRVCDVKIIYNHVGDVDAIGLNEMVVTPSENNATFDRKAVAN